MSDPKQNKPQTNLPENAIIDPNFERMLKSFSHYVQKNGILEEVRERRYHEKPSEIRHKMVARIKRLKKLERRRRRKK